MLAFHSKVYCILFVRVIPEEGPPSQQPENVKSLIFVSGKLYYELRKERNSRGLENDIAIARIEQVTNDAGVYFYMHIISS